MKNFVALWLCSITSLGNLALADQSYPMICQGGAGMYGPVDALTLDGKTSARIKLTFKRGQTARNPLPGECVWMDRAIRSDEPNRLSYLTAGNQSVSITHNGIVSGNGPVKYLIDGLVQRKYFYVHVYQVSVPTFEPFFNVTRLGP